MRGNMLKTLGLVGTVLTLAACSGQYASEVGSGSSSSMSGASALGKITMSVQDQTNNAIVYSDKVTTASLQLTAGKPYKVNLAVANPVAGATFKLQTTQTNIPGGSTQTIPLVLGSNNSQVPNGTQGDYAWKLVASVPGGGDAAKSYVASVQCASPTLKASDLNANALTVSSSVNNIYTFDASGVVPSGNFQCAFDVTGTGIQDTAFGDCRTPVSAYVNLVGNRKIGVLVKDSCFTTVTISKTLNLPATTPSMPGNVFIQGLVSNASGTVVGDPRVDGVSYLATNVNGNNIVQPNYANGAFTIQAMQNYGMASSVKFGMAITVKGLTDNLNMSAGTGSISAANASIQKVLFSTDQAGDAAPLVSLSTQACTLTNQGANAQPISGQPCSAGQTGSNNGFRIEVYGHYSCPAVSASGASVKIEGDFDGYYNKVDNCSGGGGGGGGVAPITL